MPAAVPIARHAGANSVHGRTVAVVLHLSYRFRFSESLLASVSAIIVDGIKRRVFLQPEFMGFVQYRCACATYHVGDVAGRSGRIETAKRGQRLFVPNS